MRDSQHFNKSLHSLTLFSETFFGTHHLMTKFQFQATSDPAIPEFSDGPGVTSLTAMPTSLIYSSTHLNVNIAINVLQMILC